MQDPWDRAAQGIADAKGLASLARRFLADRGDGALGLAPTRILDAASADLWSLYWCAARRVDDSVESGASTPQEWRTRLRKETGEGLAVQCVQALLSSRPMDAIGVKGLMDRSLRGLQMEADFTRPRRWTSYRRLLEHKSVPTMMILDALLFPGEDPDEVARHADAFAVSTQVGDDCRDVLRDVQAGRWFVTREELGNAGVAWLRRPEFANGRSAMCRRFLLESRRARLRGTRARRRAAALDGLWSHALESGQIHPTRRHLWFPPR